jgi:DNA-binding CsgD family transcriptional regulator
MIQLSNRQRQVLQLVASGCSATEIAAILGISERTVRQHSDALRMKLGAARVRQLPLAYRNATGEDPLALGCEFRRR